MKAEQRKQLETNVLADRMGRMVKDIRKGPSRRGILIWLLIIVVAVGGLIFYLFRTTYTRTESELWVTFHRGTRTDMLGKILAEHEDTTQGKAARYQLAWLHLWDLGIKDLFKGAPLAKSDAPPAYFLALKNVADAADQYEKLFRENKEDPMLGAEALYGLAVAQETLAIQEPKKLSEARENFKALANDDLYKNTAFGKRAAERLKMYDEQNFRQLQEYYTSLHLAFEDQWGEILRGLKKNEK